MRHQNIFTIEGKIKDYWRERGIEEKALKKRGEKGDFYFLDGPPYATERIHIGTSWNKVLKDAVLRYKRMRGYTVWSKPGFDTHGLPIEVMVERKLGTVRKKEILEKIGLERFNKECKNYAQRFIGVLTEQFHSLGVWMDWANPYITYTNEYISSVWWGVKEAYKKGLLAEDLMVFHWCPRCGTVLSEHEVAQEYREVEDPSIYVKLPVKGRREYILIWTTTPWTLPSNTGVMVHPNFKYARVRLASTGEVFILASKRIGEVIREPYEVLEEFDGASLEGLEYHPALYEVVPAQGEAEGGHRIVLSTQYVSEEEGTGCVHMSPEHGREDAEVARETGLPSLVLVDDEGKFMEGAGRYKGMRVFEANEEILKDLEGFGRLYRRETVLHKYPHCWRCKTPLLLKSTRQWLLKISEMRDALVEVNERIRWVPDWAGTQRFRNWVENARDWVLSRQRFWGTPLPIWRCGKCGGIEVIGSIKELEERASTHLEDLHRPYIDRVTWPCSCGGVMRRVSDVMDVWLDSGSASWASLNYPEDTETFKRLWPSDFITEGHDQTRGWFYSLLVLGLITFNDTPVKTILMHGFTLDAEGRGMHKSLGNVIYPEEILERYGVDATRIYLLKNTIWEDAIISPKEVEEVIRDINVITNIYQFYSTYAELDGFRAEEALEKVYNRLMEEDRWILSRFEGTLRSVTEDMERYHVHRALRAVLRFAVEDLSRRYIKMVRRRVWIEEESWEKTSVYITLHHVLKGLAKLLAPFAPHFSEHYYQSYVKRFEEAVEESIHLADWPTPREEWIDGGLEGMYGDLARIIAASYAIRQRVGMKIRQPLKEILIPQSLASQLTERMISLLKDQANVLEVKGVRQGKEPIDYRIRARMDLLGPRFKGKAKKVAEILEEKPPGEILQDLREKGKVTLDLAGEAVGIPQDHVEVLEEVRKPYQSESIGERGKIYLNLELTPELLELGIIRDLVRRIQEARKKLNLEMMEPVDVILETSAQAVLRAVETYEGYIKGETRAERILLQGIEEAQLVEEDTIQGEPVKIGLRRIRVEGPS